MPRRVLVALAVLALGAVAIVPAAQAAGPFPNKPGDVYDYRRLHIDHGACTPLAAGRTVPAGSDLPPGFDCRNDFKRTDYAAQPGDADYDPTVARNPQELNGVKGAGVNRAWEVTTGRPDTVIAVMDSGIEWNETALVDKVALNTKELPLPCAAAPCRTARSTNWRDYDVTHDGVVSMADYAGDPRVVDLKADGRKDAQDLIHAFSDGRDDDHNGYTDDIAGWDFYQADNDASDDVTYGHGTGEAKDSSADVSVTITNCPNCMFWPLRVGDSFVADINHFAAAVVYAVDNGASVVQEALGTIDHTGFAQVALDYAYTHGVLVVASEADEEAGHHNYPAALNHTMVVNSLTHFADENGTAVQLPKSYLAFNGCTNFGGYTWVSVESASCSSDATGQAAGMAGLVYSAARNAVQDGVIQPDASGRPLAAEEAKQLYRLAAQDIDFSTPRLPYGPPNNFVTTLPATQRYVTTAGWDQITGWGRINADTLLHLVKAGQIPPEADIASPRWWQPLATAGHVTVTGSAAAPRVGAYTWQFQYAPGVQPPMWPAKETWTTFASGTGSGTATAPVSGSLDLAKVRHAIDTAVPAYTPATDPTSRDLPEKDSFRVRLVVKTPGSGPASTAIEQRQFFSTADADLAAGFPKYLDADGAGSPAFADITGDGVDELLIADGNGFVHAFEADGTEAAGWPRHTNAIALPASGTNAFTSGAVGRTVYAPVLLGSPLASDLDGDGRPEVSVADVEGFLYVWHSDGKVAAGFPVQVNRAYSENAGCQTAIGPACDDLVAHPVRDHVNTVDHAFTSSPTAAQLDAHAGKELVIGSNDGHVYAWHADGTPVTGWPVLLRDPAKVASVDPVSHRITFKPDAKPFYGRQVIASVSAADVNGDGFDEIAVNVDEEYDEAPNWSVRDLTLAAAALLASPGNTRTYLLWPDGTAHPAAPGVAIIPNLGNNAYLPGWPVKIGMLETELLPDVGSGSNGPPVFVDVNGDGTPEIVTASIASPPYLLKVDGSSYYGNGPDGNYLTMGSLADEFKNPAATDAPSVASLGGAVAGRLAGPASPVSVAMGATGLRRLLDVVLPDQQVLGEDHIDAWDAATGTFEPGFPSVMNDLMFFNTPAIADVNGDGLAEVLQSSAMYDLRAYGLGGVVPLGWPKFTGGWSVSTPAVGDLDGDGRVEVALMTREGNLFVWHTSGRPCAGQEWPTYQHDNAHTGDYGRDATPPSAVGALAGTAGKGSAVVRWTAPGGDRHCGTAASYRVVVDGTAVMAGVPAPSAAGAAQSVTLALTKGKHTISVQAVDAAGNAGFPRSVTVKAG